MYGLLTPLRPRILRFLIADNSLFITNMELKIAQSTKWNKLFQHLA